MNCEKCGDKLKTGDSVDSMCALCWSNRKIVAFPIKVPTIDYCWKSDDSIVCESFDNEGGHPHCRFDMYPLNQTKEGFVTKPPECKCLENITKEKK